MELVQQNPQDFAHWAMVQNVLGNPTATVACTKCGRQIPLTGRTMRDYPKRNHVDQDARLCPDCLVAGLGDEE